MPNHPKAPVGNPSTSIENIEFKARNKLWAQIESARLGKKQKKISTKTKPVDKEALAEARSHQHWYWLIDYKNGNAKILKRALTTLQAAKRNQMLEGSGRAWARIG